MMKLETQGVMLVKYSDQPNLKEFSAWAVYRISKGRNIQSIANWLRARSDFKFASIHLKTDNYRTGDKIRDLPQLYYIDRKDIYQTNQ